MKLRIGSADRISRRYLWLLTLVCVPAWAAEVAGTWEVTMKAPGGERTNTMVITQQEDSYFAAMSSPRGLAEIGEIQVTGNRIEFRFSRKFDGGEINMHYQGEVTGDTLSGTVTTMRGAIPFRGVRK